MANVNAPIDKKTIVKHKESRSMYYDAWLRLKRNKTAIFGLFFVILLIIVAVFAKYIAPHNPNAQNLMLAFKHLHRTFVRYR